VSQAHAFSFSLVKLRAGPLDRAPCPAVARFVQPIRLR